MILDTNAVSALATVDSKLISKLPSDRPWYIPVVAIGEFRFGAIGSDRKSELVGWLDELIRVVPVLEITEITAKHYATVRHQLKRNRVKIPPNDSWIAALGIEHSLPVLTRDKHFNLIEGLEVRGW